MAKATGRGTGAVAKQGLYREFFLHVDIVIMMVVLAALAAFTLNKAFTLLSGLLFVAGLAAFMFSEYTTHRFLFHLKTPKQALFLRFLKRLHYDHHTDPNDLKLLFLPVWYSLPNLTVFSALFYVVTGNLEATLAFAAGLVCMLLVYEWKHYVAHRPIQPVTKLGKWVKRTHLLHHYKNENYWYGVSTPFVDALFGTLKDEKDVPVSDTVKQLEQRGK
ncbi:sterol desaturase family protein [Paenibacillus sp. MMS18-CY102]|uniref:sterol desaturase family protein n=1 Tax=Paenibacillus sp. MMS18-CY102 TaxID=2682849 RepID=UPI00136532A6|nr:sterol desaturase family protein [Paenibacillus sp. MMS18-CY102]MWC29350.1 fatty acid hydroxylase family protein [Paenibacillus sp. MMS18-CY102]